MSNLAAKWEKVLKKHGEWVDAAESKKDDELRKEILTYQGVIADMEAEMENDTKLISLKEEVKTLTSNYREEINAARAKSAYCLHLLRSRGA